jgi:hypothetical protein
MLLILRNLFYGDGRDVRRYQFNERLTSRLRQTDKGGIDNAFKRVCARHRDVPLRQGSPRWPKRNMAPV